MPRRGGYNSRRRGTPEDHVAKAHEEFKSNIGTPDAPGTTATGDKGMVANAVAELEKLWKKRFGPDRE